MQRKARDAGSFDVAVCGAGLAGLVAALRAAELGASVLLIEAGDGDEYPCNSRWSGGVLHAAYRDVTIDHAELSKAVRYAAGDDADATLVDALVQDASRAVQWLRQQGIRVIKANVGFPAWVLAPPRRAVTHIEWRGYGPDVALRKLTERLVAAGGNVKKRTRATDLMLDRNRCSGIRASIDGVMQDFSARAVVLADGGFAGNHDMFRRHIGTRPDLVVQRGAGTGRGDALRMATSAGAAIGDLRWFYGHLLSRDAQGNDRLWPYPQLDFAATAGILVNSQGVRILDEGLGGIYAANMLARLPDPTDATIIIGESIWDGPGLKDGMVPCNPKLQEMGGTVYQADSIETLANRAGIHARTLALTVSKYNEAVQTHTLMTLTPPRSERKAPAWPIEPPYLALPACAGITYTTGGVLIDEHSRVRADGGGVIAGLYAAGATTGGLEGGSVAGYVGGLLKAAVQGLRAAEHSIAN